MTGFSADWLKLRAGADARSRDPGLGARLSAHFAGRDGLTVLDLGAGTGNNMGATAPLLPYPQHWRLADADAGLLARAAPPEGVSCTPVACDLASGIAPLLAPLPDLVTASALFDLAGADWIAALVAEIARHRLPVYAVLSYNGQETWAPPHPDDDLAFALFHADQGRAKGLGPALGPSGANVLADCLDKAGYRVSLAASDWVLTAPEDGALIAALAQSSAEAIRPAMGTKTDAWLAARRGASQVRVGHWDVLAFPPA